MNQSPNQPNFVDMSSMSTEEKIDTIVMAYNNQQSQLQMIAAQLNVLTLALDRLSQEITKKKGTGIARIH